jgi:zinc protease
MLAEVAGGGGVTSRFAKALQLDQRIAINSGAFYSGSAYDDGTFGYYGVPAEGVSLDQIETALEEVMAELAAKGPTEAELERAKTIIRASEIYSQDSQQGLAQKYGAGLTIGLTIEQIESWPDTLAKVTAEDVKAAAANWLRPDYSVTGRLIQAEEASQ